MEACCWRGLLSPSGTSRVGDLGDGADTWGGPEIPFFTDGGTGSLPSISNQSRICSLSSAARVSSSNHSSLSPSPLIMTTSWYASSPSRAE